MVLYTPGSGSSISGVSYSNPQGVASLERIDLVLSVVGVIGAITYTATYYLYLFRGTAEALSLK